MTLSAATAAGPKSDVSLSVDSGAMSRSHKDMRRVLEKLNKLGAQPLGTCSPAETRKQPTPADAVRAVLVDQGVDPHVLAATMKISKRDVTYPTGGGFQKARIYKPDDEGIQNPAGLPVIVYYHGGGWMIADIDTYEASAMALAMKVVAIVVSIEYRKAPENKFPAQHEDAFNAYKWALLHARSWGGDPRRVAVAGESAGGNLALNVAIKARDKRLQAPVHMLLVYPIAGVDMSTPSYLENEHAMPLSKLGMKWFLLNTISSEGDKESPMLDLVGGADLTALPSTTLLTAEIDPLKSEGQDLAAKLSASGVEVAYENFEGVCHEFFGMSAVVDAAARAQDVAAARLKSAFDSR